jgi:hypothetical protein
MMDVVVLTLGRHEGKSLAGRGGRVNGSEAEFRDSTGIAGTEHPVRFRGSLGIPPSL